MYTTEQYKQLEAERDALKKQNNAYATLTKAQEARLVKYGEKQVKRLDAVATLDSEKEANAILTQDRDALALQNQHLIDAAKGLMEWQVKNVKVWHNHAYDNMDYVINKSDHSEIIKQHDADKKDALARISWAEAEIEGLQKQRDTTEAKFQRLCKDFDARNERIDELTRIIATQRAELDQAKTYMPGNRAKPMPKTEPVGKTNFAFFGLIETDEEFAERAGRQIEEVAG